VFDGTTGTLCAVAEGGGSRVAWLELSCAGWTDGDSFPERFRSASPPCSWSEPGARVKSFAILLEDLDAEPGEPRVLWLVYDLDEVSRGVSGALGRAPDVPGGGHQGRNDLGTIGWAGVPHGDRPHRLALRLLALDRRSGLPGGAFPIDFFRAAVGHVVESSELIAIVAGTELRAAA
jgi:phosphatidylethanolamine-binding protein (PEBP) family uncharacterized protein